MSLSVGVWSLTPLNSETDRSALGAWGSSGYLWRKRLRGSAAPTPTKTDAGQTLPEFLDLGLLPSCTSGEPSWDLELDLGAGVVLRLRRG